jgi:divinyl protochlorophyllide a 8-vinyl-reductase
MSAAGAMAAVGPTARIGPNAVTRMAEALRALHGEAMAARIFAAAALTDLLRHPPEEMIDERDVARLHRSVHSALGAKAAAEVGRDAGARTGAYLLDRRIPRPVQWILRRLPAVLAARVLVAAISRHAWTFAGSGEFGVRWRRGGVRLTIARCPLCRDVSASDPACDFYCATFERLFGELVRAGSTVTEVTCQVCGGEACVFEARW